MSTNKGEKKNKCVICKEMFDDGETYEYRGFLACAEHFDELQRKVDHKRKEVMEAGDFTLVKTLKEIYVSLVATLKEAVKKFKALPKNRGFIKNPFSDSSKPAKQLGKEKVKSIASSKSTTTPKSSQVDNPLIQEARKYKSAEEFVNKVENSTEGIGSVGKIADSFSFQKVDTRPVGELMITKIPLGAEIKKFQLADGFGDLPKVMKDTHGNVFVYLKDGVDPSTLNKKTLANLVNSNEPWNKNVSKKYITNDNGQTWLSTDSFELGSVTSGMTKSQLTDIWNKANLSTQVNRE